MPRDGSPSSPPATVPPAPMIGDAVDPPFAILPDPGKVFERRSARFLALAPGHQIESYLRFLAGLTAAQHAVQGDLPPPVLPSADSLRRAHDNAMPPLSVGQLELGEAADHAFLELARKLRERTLTPASRAAVEKVLAASPEVRTAMLRAVLLDDIPQDAVAEHVIAAAAAQVHIARAAAALDVATLVSVADGACPACGGAPVASAIVGWEGAHGTRFCTCSMCATQWHVVRIKCLLCGAEKGIAYHSLEEGAKTILAETCESCSGYVKILHQHKDPALEPVADDAASLALDVVLGREGWARGSVNPFLMGY